MYKYAVNTTAVLVALMLFGCMNGSRGKSSQNSSTATTSASTSSTSTSTSNVTFEITKGTLILGNNVAKVYLKTTNSAGNSITFATVCPAGKCTCRWSWSQVIVQGTSSITISRKDKTFVTDVQPYVGTCAAPVAWPNVPKGTRVGLTIWDAAKVVRTQKYSVIKGEADQLQADFKDVEGTPFQNIHSYSCYEVTKTVPMLGNKIIKAPPPDGSDDDEMSVLLATGFCASRKGRSNDQEKCKHMQPESQFSADTKYYNLFIRSRGQFSLSNKKFQCPLVKEALGANNSIGSQQKPWPFDSTFALAQSPTDEFNVGIVAPATLGISDDLNSVSTKCTGPIVPNTTAASGDISGSISTQCIGFAKKPNPDGTCGSFIDDGGKTVLTYRLRRYTAIFPASYDSTGHVIEQPLASNTIYVMDRPIANSPNPFKPYTMLGPKPCNWAVRDHSGTLGLPSAVTYQSSPARAEGLPGWRATNNTAWDDKNVNGIAFPWHDSATINSCAALFPLIKYSASGNPQTVGYGTSHATNLDGAGVVQKYDLSDGGTRTISMNKVYVRPTKSWAPHYEEDTSFKACAPRSAAYVDPPIHLAKRVDGNIAWCTESYPTQFDAVEKMDTKFGTKPTDVTYRPGYVKTYTSHVSKRAPNSSECIATPIAIPTVPAAYPANAMACAVGNTEGTANGVAPARHPDGLFIDGVAAVPICATKTCDRTIVNNVPAGLPTPPLIAEPNQVENMLFDDASYACLVTYDNGMGKAGKRSPSDGCCHSLHSSLNTGGVGVVRDIAAYNSLNGAHIEPGLCEAPKY